jgi:hypothetical protein
MRTLCRLGVAVLILIGAAGCGKKYYPADGQVVFKDGTPLSGGIVYFEPLDATARTSARADIHSDGTFQLGTEVQGDGAPEGRYRVTIIPPLAPPAQREKKQAPEVIHPRYQHPETSGLEYTVTSDPGKNHFRIEVDRPDARPKK